MILPWSSPLDEHAARRLAVHLCEYACDGSRGRPEKGDPVYDAVTEGRDFGPGYSSCADLAHWLLFRLGVRHSFLNRAEHLGWEQGVNLSRLAWCRYAVSPTAEDRFEPGDILIVWNHPQGRDGHVCVVIQDGRVERGQDELETANYGAPGGAIKTSPVSYSKVLSGPRRAVLGKRVIQRWVPLGRLLAGAQREGKLVDADDPTRGEEGAVVWEAGATP